MAFDRTSETGSGVTGALWTGAGPAPSAPLYTGDFSIAVSPSTRTADAIRILDYGLTLSGDYTGPVRLSVSGLQPGMLCLFDSDPVTVPTSLFAHIYVDPSVIPGTYPISFVGSGPSTIVHSVAATLIVATGSGGTSGHGSIEILIDGLDRTDYLHYESSNSWNVMRMNRGTSSLAFIIEPGETFAPQIGQLVEIYDDSLRVWIGTIDTVEVKWLGNDGWHVTMVTGVTLESLFDSVQLDKLQFATTADVPLTCGAMVSQLFTDADIPIVGLGIISDGPVVKSLSVTNVKSALDTLATIAGFIWYVDPRDAKLYFHSPGLRAADWTLNDGASSAEGAVFETIQWKQTRSDFADTQVMQLPGVASSSQVTTFAGDGTRTVFTLPIIPQYVQSLVVEPSGSGIVGGPFPFTLNWTPGTNKVSCTPALDSTQSLVVTWLDSGQVVVSSPAYGAMIGHRARRFTLTRSFTRDGVIQQATAALARYALLPSELQFDIDKPGCTIGRALTIGITKPTESGGLVNGVWQVIEVDGQLIAGMDQKSSPWGHFRYTIRLVNFEATAVYQGDGATSTFVLPEIPTSVGTPTVLNSPFPIGGYSAVWNPGTPDINVTPAPPLGATLTLPYTSQLGAPDTQPFINTWEGTTQTGTDSGTSTPAGPDNDPPEYFERTLTIRDSTVGNNLKPQPCAQHAGIGTRVLMTPNKDLTADYVIRLNKTDASSLSIAFSEMLTVTVPAHSPVDGAIEVPLQTGSPATGVIINDKDVFGYDILASDGQVVTSAQDALLSITIQWEYDY